MILQILKYPHPVLAKKAAPVAKITPQIRKLAEDMLETMYDAEGVGLAAPQIGEAIRMIVMDAAQREGRREPRVIVNPQVEPTGETIVSEAEGCLSVPLNFRADVPRCSTIRLTGLNLDGSAIDENLEGLAAIIAQHEVDHLDGTLFIDRISHLRRTIYDNKVKKWQKTGA